MANDDGSSSAAAANSQQSNQHLLPPESSRQDEWGFIKMPPRASRHSSATPTPSPHNQRRSPASASVRTGAQIRQPGDIRSPLVAKYSTNYGSSLTKLPERVAVGGGKLETAAASVFHKVRKDNQASEARRNSATRPTTEPSGARQSEPPQQPQAPASEAVAEEVDLVATPQDGDTAAKPVEQGETTASQQRQSRSLAKAREEKERAEREAQRQKQLQEERDRAGKQLEEGRQREQERLEKEAEIEEIRVQEEELERRRFELVELEQQHLYQEQGGQRRQEEREREARRKRKEKEALEAQNEARRKAEQAQKLTQKDARKRARDDAEAEAAAEKERVERDARLRREKSAEARLRANQKLAEAQAASKASKSNVQPPVPLFPETPAGLTGQHKPAGSVRSFLEESDIVREAELLTPIRDNTSRPGKRLVSTLPINPPPIPPPPVVGTKGSTTSSVPPVLLPPGPAPIRSSGATSFVPEPRPTKSTAPAPPLNSTHDKSQTQPEIRRSGRRPLATLTGATNVAPPAKPSVLGPDTSTRPKQNSRGGFARPHTKGQLMNQDDGETDQDSESDEDEDDLAEGPEIRSTGTTAQSSSHIRQRRTHSQSTGSNARRSLTDGSTPRSASIWSKIRLPSISGLLKTLLIGAAIYALLASLLSIEWSTLTAPRAVLSDEQFDELKNFFQDPSNLTPGSRENLEAALPRMIHVKRDRRGKLIIDDEFWLAMRDRIQQDDSIFTLGAGSQISEHQWKALKDRLQSDGGQPTTQSWERWLKNNHEQVIKLLGENTKDTKGKLPAQVVTKAEFMKELEKATSEVEGAWRRDVGEIQKSLRSLVSDVTKLKSQPPPGLTQEEMKKLVNDIVKQVISNAQLNQAAKTKIAGQVGAELRGRINHFAPGNGAFIARTLSSPTYVAPAKSGYWRFRTARPQFFKETIAALTTWEEAGQCWCAGIKGTNNATLPADIGVKLSNLVIPQYVVVEHIDPKATIDPDAMPKDMELWAYFDKPVREQIDNWARLQFPETYDTAAEDPHVQQTIKNGFVKVGEFTYTHSPEDDGVQVHKLSQELVSTRMSTDHVIVRAKTNYGADHTCFYRIRMYGDVFDYNAPEDKAEDTDKEKPKLWFGGIFN